MTPDDAETAPTSPVEESYVQLYRRKTDEARNDSPSTAELIELALQQHEDDNAQWDTIKVLQYRATQDVVEEARHLCMSTATAERSLGATLLGQLGIPERAFPEELLQILAHCGIVWSV